MNKPVYMDYAATTYTKPEVLEEMLPYFTEFYGNPSSIYSISRETKKAIDKARSRVAKAINADSTEIYFTGGGSEADNWAIKGIALANKNKGNHIITTKIEHHAVLHTCEYLEKQGFEVTYLDVDENGAIRLEDLKNAIKPTTVLVTIMAANNEIGTIQPIKEIGEICKERKVFFHTDAVQAIGHIDMDVKDMNIDALSLSGHKIYGPKGVGVLYLRKGIRIHNLVHGGAQERNRRAGTENVAGIVGLGKAIELAMESLKEEKERLTYLRDKLIKGLLAIPYSKLNGPRGDKRLPGNVNISFEFIEGESVLLMLDAKGICASSGSACTSGSLDPSHVLLAIGLPHEVAHGSLRLSMGAKTTEEEVDYVIETVPAIVQRLRDMSPLYDSFINGKCKSFFNKEDK
ncbi:MAG: cysteine desulfurase NifS [Clostridium sp.]